ncbi:MAG: hypothetical protein Q8S18_09300 [Bacteroidales bacterium]|nr:hypothetical protein [Bacteroidales bacterium]
MRHNRNYFTLQWVGCGGPHEQRAGGRVNAKTVGNPAKQTAPGGLFV